MQRFLSGRTMGAVMSLAAVAGIILFYRHVLHVNQTTVALSFLLAILAVSAVRGMAVSVFMSVLAMLSFNYFFLPPVGTFTITDPQNLVALFAFLITSITGSQLSSRIRKEADEAHRRRREVERLYRFSRQLLGEGNVIQLMNAIPDYIVESFEAGAAELFLQQKDKFYRSGFGAAHLDEEKMKTAFLHDEVNLNAEQSEYFVPVRLGVRPIGSLGISGAQLSRQSLEAVGTLVASAIEGARAVEQLGQVIDNANLYSPGNQPITITAELTGDNVTISVSDRGPGIDDFEQTMIFDKFYRGKDQRYLVRGTGMGLPIAKAIIAAQQGNMSVTSQLGHGSVFSFTLPVDRSQKDAR